MVSHTWLTTFENLDHAGRLGAVGSVTRMVLCMVLVAVGILFVSWPFFVFMMYHQGMACEKAQSFLEPHVHHFVLFANQCSRANQLSLQLILCALVHMLIE